MPDHQDEPTISRKEVLDWFLRGVLALLIIVGGIMSSIIAYQGNQVIQRLDNQEARIRDNTNAITRLNQADSDTQRRLSELGHRLSEMDDKLDLILKKLP